MCDDEQHFTEEAIAEARRIAKELREKWYSRKVENDEAQGE